MRIRNNGIDLESRAAVAWWRLREEEKAMFIRCLVGFTCDDDCECLVATCIDMIERGDLITPLMHENLS